MFKYILFYQRRLAISTVKWRERKKRRCLRFFVGFPGDALTASRASVATLAIFASRRTAKTLVGEPPQTRLWDFLSQSNCLRHRRLSLLFLFALAIRDAQQMIDIGLDRHGLPHLLLRRSVVSVECLFPRRQLAAFFF